MKYVHSLVEMLPAENDSHFVSNQLSNQETLVSLNERNFNLKNIIKAPLTDFIEHYQVEEMSDSTLQDFDENGDSICSNFDSSNELELLEDESLENLTFPNYY